MVVLRFTLWRLLIFFGCLLVFWLVGLRNDPVLLLFVSAAASLVLSYFLLRRQRDQLSEQIDARIQSRRSVRAGREEADEAAEDAEAGQAD